MRARAPRASVCVSVPSGPSSAEFKHASRRVREFRFPPKSRPYVLSARGVKGGTRIRFWPHDGSARVGKARRAPAKSRRSSAARSATARAIARGTQSTLNFSGNLTLSGTFKGTVNINNGGAGGRGSRCGLCRRRDPPTRPTPPPTDRTSPSTRPTAPPRKKGVRFHCFLSDRGYAILMRKR